LQPRRGHDSVAACEIDHDYRYSLSSLRQYVGSLVILLYSIHRISIKSVQQESALSPHPSPHTQPFVLCALNRCEYPPEQFPSLVPKHSVFSSNRLVLHCTQDLFSLRRTAGCALHLKGTGATMDRQALRAWANESRGAEGLRREPSCLLASSRSFWRMCAAITCIGTGCAVVSEQQACMHRIGLKR
jgi:hypothetical protein